MLEYTKCLADSLKLFYVRYEDHLKVCDVHEKYTQRSKGTRGSIPSNTEVKKMYFLLLIVMLYVAAPPSIVTVICDLHSCNHSLGRVH